MAPAVSVPVVPVLVMPTLGTKAVTGLLTDATQGGAVSPGLHRAPKPAAGVAVAVLLTVPVADAAS